MDFQSGLTTELDFLVAQTVCRADRPEWGAVYY